MTPFAAAWADRHDGECESLEAAPAYGSDSLLLSCRCYVRWLEGRLGEVLEELKRHVVPVPKETPSC